MADNVTLNAGSGGSVVATDDIGSVHYQRVKISQGADGSASDVSTANPLPVQIGGPAQIPYGIVAKASAFGGLQTSGALTRLFDDTFDAAFDTTNKWTLSGTSSPTQSGTAAVLSLAASNAISSVMVSQPSFTPVGQPYQLAAQLAIGTAQVNPNCHRFFGMGVVSSYASATPLTDGFGWEVDLTGALNAVLYIGGTRYVVTSTNGALVTGSGSWAAGMTLSNYGANLTYPATGVAIVSAQYFNGFVYFYLAGSATGFDVPVGVATYIPNVVSLPVRFAAITTPAVSTVLATTFTVSSFLLGIVGGTNFTQADATFPWRQQQVDSSGRASMITPELSSTGSITTQNLVPAGTATANSAVSLTTNGFPTLMVQVTGTYTGALSLQVTVDNTNWITLGGTPLINVNTGGYLASITSALAGVFQADIGGAIAARITGLAAMTGTAVVTMRAVAGGPTMVGLDAALPTGANTIGAVNIAAAQTLATVTTVGTVTTVTTTGTLTNITNWGNVVDDAAFTPATTRVLMVGYEADETATDSVDEGDAGAARMTLDRKQIITPYVHAAAGGWTPYKNLDCDESEDDIKTSPGKLGWIHVINRSTGVRYLKLYNDTAANVIVGTTVPVLSFPVPTMADTNGAGFTIGFGDAGVQFSVAICVAATTGVADADTGAPGTNDIVLNAGFL